MAISEAVNVLRGLIGEKGTAKILAVKGGQEVYIPSPDGLTPEHWLVEILGMEDAAKVAEYYQHEKISFPLGPNGGTRNALQKKVVDMTLAGLSVNVIVQETGLHCRTVRRIRTKYLG